MTKQRSIGVAYTRGYVLSFFDDDVVLNEHYFQKIVEYFERFKNISISGADLHHML
ncbi:MAG: glycosyltransferase [Proteobacteria bacterium]|nr:glycosyltransferase [Pseudomonadota bacterium]